MTKFDTLIRTIESDDEIENYGGDTSEEESFETKPAVRKSKKDEAHERILKQHVSASKTFFGELDTSKAEEEMQNIKISFKNEALRNKIQKRAEEIKQRSTQPVVEEDIDEEKIKNQVRQELLKQRNAKYGIDSDDDDDDDSDDEFNAPPPDSDEEAQEKELITKRIAEEKKRLAEKNKKIAAAAIDIDQTWGDDEQDDDDDEELDQKLNEDIFAAQTTITTSDLSGDNALTVVPEDRDFSDLHLSRPLIQAIKALNFDKPTPIQTAAIPIALSGHDLLANAATGSGKTAAFLLPIIERILHQTHRVHVIRAIVVSPTRELAEQIYKLSVQLTKYTDVKSCCVVGGVSREQQEMELRNGPDIVICTPGRLIDHLANSKSVDIDDVEILVLDEADRLLEMGFIDEIREIVKSCPRSRQTLLFSATLNDEVKELIHLSLKSPKKISVDKNTSIVDTLTQEFVRVRQDSELIRQSIVLALCKRTFKSRTIIFARTKLDAHKLLILFGLCGLNAAELHGNLTQAQRTEALNMFRSHKVDYLICTDIAARGIDIKGVQTVINMHMPRELPQYIHRVGRTARAGNKGRSVSIVSEDERRILRDIMKAARNVVKKREVPPEVLTLFTQKISSLQDDIEKILQDEKVDRDIQMAERDLKKVENITKHAEEIMSRPQKSWFQSKSEKEAVKQASLEAFKALAETDKTISELKKLSAEAQDQTNTTKKEEGIEKDPLRGLSRAKKRRKLMQMESKKIIQETQKEIEEYKHMLNNNEKDKNISEKELRKKQKMLDMLQNPEKVIKAAKRKAKKEAKIAEEAELQDGAGPDAFLRQIKKQKREHYEFLGKKRKNTNDTSKKSSVSVQDLRFAEQGGSSEVSRFAEASRKYGESLKRQREMDKQASKPSAGSGFKSQKRYKRRG